MRIIAGTAKGLTLLGPKTDSIRPVLDKVKGAIFNILYDVSGKTILDLFAGTGSIGLEALSRGAASATFVDNSPEALKIVRENLKRAKFENNSQILKVRLPFRRWTDTPSQFDLIFNDPPYDRRLVHPTIEAIVREKLLAPAGIVIVEHSPRETIEDIEGLTLTDQRKYGQTLISFLKGI